MKLRNIITNEICDAEMREDGIYIKANWSDEEKWFCYDLETLARGWEYYVDPKEPLIKDEKVRKAIRAWAEANAINSGNYYNTDIKFNVTEHRLQWIQTAIEFNDITGLDNLEDGETYTIAELCGEEE